MRGMEQLWKQLWLPREKCGEIGVAHTGPLLQYGIYRRATYMCRPYIIYRGMYRIDTCNIAVNMRLYEYGHEQAK